MGVGVKELFFKIELTGAPENRRKTSVKGPEFLLALYNVSNSPNRELWSLGAKEKLMNCKGTSGDSVQAR